jgi:hypothetical protein
VVFFKGPNCSGPRSFSGNVPASPPVPRPDHLQFRFRHADARPAIRSTNPHSIGQCPASSPSSPSPAPRPPHQGPLILALAVAVAAVAWLRRGQLLARRP